MRLKRNRIYTLEDVRKWRELKKDELELEKLKLQAEKQAFESEIRSGIGKIFMYEGILLVGQKIVMKLLKSLFKEYKKETKKSKEED
jgi:hypothetical protein